MRGGRSVRSAPGVPARSREPPTQQRRPRRPRAPLVAHTVSTVLHLGSHGRDAHEPVFFPEKLIVRAITFEAMSLLSLVAALLLEQWRPLADRRYLYALLARYATFLEGLFNAGETRQGAIAWVIAVLPAVLGAWLVYMAAYRASPLLALLLNVSALYLTMGFRQRSHYFTDIHLALKEDDLAKARDVLSSWRGADCSNLDREAVTRLAIEEALVASHRHVFAVVFWFVFLPGPAGAILYR